MKSPWLAALLNIVPFPMGLGYLYLGRRRAFAVTLPVGVAALIAGVLLYAAASDYEFHGEFDINIWALLLPLLGLEVLLLGVATALHAYFLAGGTVWRRL